MNKAEIDRALVLAQQLNDAAKSVPIQVDALLGFIGPNARLLRSLGKKARTTPREIVMHLRSTQARFKRSKRLRQAVAALVPDEAKREAVVAGRVAMLEFHERIALIPRARREGELKGDLEGELSGILARCPASPFEKELLTPEADGWFRRTLGEARWLVCIPGDDAHAAARERLQREMKDPDAISPMDAWQFCPSVCSSCWYALKDRLRLAKSVHVTAAGMVDPDDLISKKHAAALLGIRPEGLSRYIGGDRVAKWAMSDRDRFRRLLALKGGALLRSNIEELLAWRKEETGK